MPLNEATDADVSMVAALAPMTSETMNMEAVRPTVTLLAHMGEA